MLAQQQPGEAEVDIRLHSESCGVHDDTALPTLLTCFFDITSTNNRCQPVTHEADQLTSINPSILVSTL